MNKKLIRWDFWTGVTLLAIVVFGLFLIYPLFSLFITAFQDPETGTFTLGHFAHFFERKYYYQSMINSFSVTTCVTVLAIVIGTILARPRTVLSKIALRRRMLSGVISTSSS